MKNHYDFTDAVRNPYVKRLKKQLTIRLDAETLHYFQELAGEMSLPCQTLMNMFLRECAATRRRPHWIDPQPRKRANPQLERSAEKVRPLSR